MPLGVKFLFLAILLTPTLVKCQLTWKGGLKYLVSPPYKRQMMQQDGDYDNSINDNVNSLPREAMNLDKPLQKPSGRWW